MDRHEVVIIGAGLAGLQCARLLSRAGVRVLLADRKTALSEAIHTTGIFARRTVEDFALPEDCLGPAIRRVVLYSPARRALALESPHDEFRIGRMGALYTRFLDECRAAGVDWSPRTHYTGSKPSGQSTIVSFETDGRPWEVETKYVVGADGAVSRVARDLSLDSNTNWIAGAEDVGTGLAPPSEPVLHCFLDPALAPGYIAWVAHSGEEAHVGVGGYSARFEAAEALERFERSLAGLFDLRAMKVVERRGGRIPVGGVLRRIANPRGLLAGDAAGAVSPLTAGGLDPCMRLSSLAAAVISRYLASGDPGALAAYSGEQFRRHFTTRLWLRRVISEVRSRPVIEAAHAAFRLPPVRRVAEHVFFGRGSFPDVDASPTIHPAP